jgi:hypothetical protein
MHFNKIPEMQSLRKEVNTANYSMNELTNEFNNLLPTSLIDDLDSPTVEGEEIEREISAEKSKIENEDNSRKASVDNISYNINPKKVRCIS